MGENPGEFPKRDDAGAKMGDARAAARVCPGLATPMLLE